MEYINLRENPDATSSYDIVIDKPITVQQFIDEVMQDYKGCDTFRIWIDNVESTNNTIYYENGMDITKHINPNIYNQRVINATMNFGYGHWSFYMKIDNKIKTFGNWTVDNGNIVCSFCDTWFYIDDRIVYMKHCPYCGKNMNIDGYYDTKSVLEQLKEERK